MNNLDFNEWYPTIIAAIRKRKSKWYKKIAWMDFDDIEMMIVTHIHNKWMLYNGKYPFINWVNRIITNQLRNILRNHTKNVLSTHALADGYSVKKNEEIDFLITLNHLKRLLSELLNEKEMYIFVTAFLDKTSDETGVTLFNEKFGMNISIKKYKSWKFSLHQKIRVLILNKTIDIYTG